MSDSHPDDAHGDAPTSISQPCDQTEATMPHPSEDLDATLFETESNDDAFDIDIAMYSRGRGNAIARTPITAPTPSPALKLPQNLPPSSTSSACALPLPLSLDIHQPTSDLSLQADSSVTPLQSPVHLHQPQPTNSSASSALSDPVSPSHNPIITKPFDLSLLRISENHFGPQPSPAHPTSSLPSSSTTQPQQTQHFTATSGIRTAPHTPHSVQHFAQTPSHKAPAPPLLPQHPQTPQNIQATNPDLFPSNTTLNLYQQQHKQALAQLKRHSLTGGSLINSVRKLASSVQLKKKTQTITVPYIPTLFDPEPPALNPASSPHPSQSRNETNPTLNSFDLTNINQLHSHHYINGLKLWTVSLNMGAHDIGSGGKYKKEVLHALPQLFPPGMDIYVLAVQEGKGEAISDLVNAYLSEHHDVFKLNAFPMVEGRGDGSFLSTKYTGIVCYARRNLIPFISIIGSTPYSLGITQGSKGGGCLALMIFGLTFLFIGVHLPANSLSGRLDSITSILSGCLAKMFPSLSGFEATNCIHNVIFMGDTNFKMQISDLDALNCIYDQGILNKQKGWAKPLGDSGTNLPLFPSSLGSAAASLSSPSSSNLNSGLINSPSLQTLHSVGDSSSTLFSSPSSSSSSSSTLGLSASVTTALKQYDRSYGLAWMYGMDELQTAHKQYGLLSTFSEPYPSPLLFPTYKRIEGTVLSSPHDADEIKSIFRTRFKEAFYKGGNVVVRVPAFTDRIVYHSLSHCMHPLRYSTSLQNVDNIFFTGYQYQRSVLPLSDITNQLIFLEHQLGNQEKLHKTYAVSQKLLNQPAYISSLSFHHSSLIPQRDANISQQAYNLFYPSQTSSFGAKNITPVVDLHTIPLSAQKATPHYTAPQLFSTSQQPSPNTATASEDDALLFPQHNPRVSHLPHTCDIYSCIESLTFSDHRPVVAGFHVAIPQLSMPTILSFIDNWVQTQQASCTPPPPPSPPSEPDDNRPPPLLAPLPSSPSSSTFNNAQQLFFPPIPTLRPFSRHSLMWLEPPLQLLTNAMKRGIFSFRVMVSSLSLLIPHSTTSPSSSSPSNNNALTNQYTLLSPNNNHNLLHNINLPQFPPTHHRDHSSTTPLNSAPNSIPGQLNNLVNPSLNLVSNQPAQNHLRTQQHTTSPTTQEAQTQTKQSVLHHQNKSFSSNRFSSAEYTPYSTSSSSARLASKSGMFSSHSNLGQMKAQQSSKFDTFTAPLPRYNARNKGDLLNTSKLDTSKSSKDGFDAQGPAYSTQSKISKGSKYKPLDYVPPPPGSPLDPNDSPFIPPDQLALLERSAKTSLHQLNQHDINQLPVVTEYSYTQHPINYAKMLFPAPLEHVSFVPRMQTLHKHFSEPPSQSLIQSTSFPSAPQAPSPIPPTPPTPSSSSLQTNYQYITLPHGVDNNVALATTHHNTTTNTVRLPVLSLEISSHPQSFDAPALCTGQSTILQPYTQQQRQSYHNLYGNVVSLPAKNFKAKSGQTAINASFETTNPYAYCSLHCCFSFDLHRQRSEEEELMKQSQSMSSHSTEGQSGSYQAYDPTRPARTNSVHPSNFATMPGGGGDYNADETGSEQTSIHGLKEHPFVDLPDIIQSTLQLSLFDFLYSSQFITTGLHQTQPLQPSPNQAQQPISVDIPVYSGGSLVTAPNGLPYKLRLNVNPYYSVREDIL